MPLAGSLLPCSSILIRRHSSLLSKPLSSFRHHRHHARRRSFSLTLLSPTSFSSSSIRHDLKHPNPKTGHKPHRRPMTSVPPQNPNPSPPNHNTSRSAKKARRDAPENVLRHKIGICSRNQDLPEALRLFDAALKDSIPLSLSHYNSLLYLCSLSPQQSSRGFEIYRQMLADKVLPNEATFTSLARLASNDNNPDLAFEFVGQMAAASIPPKLRSYGPALFGFCDSGDFDKAREVEAHMYANGVVPEEPELRALLRVCAKVQKGGEVYRILHRIRSLVRKVNEETAEAVEDWFGSKAAEGVGKEVWDEGEVTEGVVKGGGGWHGMGWLGKGRWSVGRSEMAGDGVCPRCGERLVCIDIDPLETEQFARKLAKLAFDREVKSDFMGFQEWLECHGPFDAIVDGANVGLYNQHNFSFFQLNSVVNGLRQMSPSKKLPLIVLHSRRVKGGLADNPNNKKLLDSWRKAGALYATPPGSNDDWYWLYAAVNFRSLLVTNDEMRDHLFELLGTSFFPRWKEKHQVRLTFSKQGPNFHMPPPYSIVIQESERGSWHIPTISGDDIETPRQWVCATRDPAAVSSRSEHQLAQMSL